MAFKLKFWVGVVAVSCVITAFVYRPSNGRPETLPPRSTSEFEGDGPRATERRLARQIREMKEQRQLESIRDSLNVWLKDIPASDGPQLFVDPSAESVAAALRASLHNEWINLGEPREVPIALHIRILSQSDRGPIEPVPPTSIQVTTIPPNGQQSACLRFITIPRSHGILRTAGMRHFEYNAQLWGIDLGPCAAYAMFGIPGPTVQAWLTNTNHRVTTVLLSDTERRPYRNRAQKANIYDHSPRALACAANKQDQCLSLLLGEHSSPFASTPLNATFQWVVHNGRFNRPGSRLPVYGWDFGGQEAYLLSDLHRETHPADFQRFWTTMEPFDAAFSALVNREAGDWMADWAAHRIGPVPAGPVPSAKYVGVVLGVVVLGMLGAVGANRWRG